MKFPAPIPVIELARQYGATLLGDTTLLATGINEIHKVQAGDITFSDHPKYFKKSLDSAATIIILNEAVDCPAGKAILVCDQPFEVYNKLVKKYAPTRHLSTTIDPTAHVHPSAIIEPNVIIGPQVTIGAYTYIQANVTIKGPTIIGSHVNIQSGTVIGAEAFYFKKKLDHYKKWQTGGRVLIKDRVDIGPACTICRGVSGDTVIGQGSKLDGQVHIGHGAVIGENCLLAAQVGIGGKTILENDVVCYGQVGIAQNVVIGRGAVIAAKSGVSKSLPGGKTYFGIPAEPLRQHHKKLATLRQLPELMKRLEEE